MSSTLRFGVIGGLAGGLVFGMMMGMMGMLPMIAGMMGSTSPVVGFLMHMVISAVIGVGYAILMGSRRPTNANGAATGAAYGALWWVLGPLTMMPMMMGMGGIGSMWHMTAAQDAMPSLIGHLIFGVILGVVYARQARTA